MWKKGLLKISEGDRYGRLTILKEQANNTSFNILLSYNGETHTASEWSRLLKIPVAVIYRRKKRQWSDEKILTTKYNRFKKEI